MIHTVIWVPEALDELAEIWLRANNRNAVNDAVRRLDARLRIDPEDQGESREEGRRILLETPLGVIFSVQEQDRIALVLTVWSFEPHRLNP